MTNPIVPPVDPNQPVDPAPVDPVDPVDPNEDDELDPEAAPVPPQNETPEQQAARFADLEERNRKLWARLQREKNKGKPATPPAPAAPQQPKPAAPDSLTRDEAIVIAKGYSEEELEQAKKVAALEGVKVTEAVNSDLFKDWKKRRDEAARQQNAQLPASRGSRATQKKSFSTPGLSDEEHKALFNERQGR